ncbi:MAG: alpha/beta fold hydrolase [Acidobacteriota bacterium]
MSDVVPSPDRERLATARPDLHGHYWTIVGSARDGLSSRLRSLGKPWSTQVREPRVGTVCLTGVLHEVEGARDVVIIAHGLGGSTRSGYLLEAARAAAARGWSSLRISMRGCDREGEDFGHAGHVDDLVAAAASLELARYERIHVVGYSMGGHQALCWALDRPDRLTSVVAVCPPLDLARAAVRFDEGMAWFYRHLVISHLKQLYRVLHGRDRLPSPWAEVESTRGVRELDAVTVVPRHGFRDTADYYATASAGPRLQEIALPTLLVLAERDPMVFTADSVDCVESLAPPVELRLCARGGHVGFPGDLDLGEDAAPGLASQVLAWMARVT